MKLVRAGKWYEVHLASVQHPLISDAKKRFAQGLPDVHRSATAAAGAAANPEVASASGAPHQVLRYVTKTGLADALVNGLATRGVCGAWFVPTKDAHGALPVCPECERQKPHAAAAAHLVEQRAAPPKP